MTKEKKVPVGADGKPMTSWQVWLRRLCIVLLVWAALEVLLGALLVIFSGFVPADLLKGIEGLGADIDAQFFAKFLGVSAMVGAATASPIPHLWQARVPASSFPRMAISSLTSM